MEFKPDTIKVTVFHREEVSATHADLHVTVKGSSVVSGDTALKKAKEVNQLVEALTSLGVKEEAVKLQGVHVETSSGVLVKSSSASYRLKIRCEKLEQFAEMLDAIASQKNASLDRVEWKYDDDAAHERGLNLAIENAKRKAQVIADSFGVKLLGVRDFVETVTDQEAPIWQALLPQPAARSRGAGMLMTEQPSLGMDIQHNKTMQVNVEVWYRVSEFTSEQG
jgi:uncharacterized protein YggE